MVSAFFTKHWRRDNQQIVHLRFLLPSLPRHIVAGDMTSIWLMVLSSSSLARNTVSTAHRALETIMRIPLNQII